jgi:hypothetical protein
LHLCRVRTGPRFSNAAGAPMRWTIVAKPIVILAAGVFVTPGIIFAKRR